MIPNAFKPVVAVTLLLAGCARQPAAPAPAPTAAPATAATSAVADRHPLDPLSADEINAAATLLRAAPQFPGEGLFSTIVLNEPPKSEVLAFKPGTTFTRQAFSIILDRRGSRTYEVIVDLNAKSVLSWTEVKGVQAPLLDGEYDELSKIVKANLQWQAAMRKRGINDFSKVQVDGWAVGQVAAAQNAGRLMRGVTYLVDGQTNFYGRPIEGVVALVNIGTGQVLEITDTGVLPTPPPSQELDEKSTGLRTAPKRLAISQPNGASFTINGQEIRWQKWRFRYTMHPREGLVLQMVGYEDEGRVRPILYRASLSEMVVPYGDPDAAWYFRGTFDAGEVGLGRFANSLEPGRTRPPTPSSSTRRSRTSRGSPRSGRGPWRSSSATAASSGSTGMP